MSRLKQLADALSVPCGAVIRVEDIDAAAALLRAASAETVGTEWGSIQHTSEHNADLHAARLAIAGLKAERDAKQRAIDEAFAVLDAGHGMLACRDASHILRPHATKATEANSSATVTGSTACCADCDLVFRNAYGLDEATPAADACDCRELVARLADIMRCGFLWTERRERDLAAIIAAARRGGGA